MSTDQQNFDEEDDACTVCKSKDTWRIKLRGAEAEENKIDEARDEDEESSTKPMLCGHVICIYCLLKYLEIWIEKDKPRIKCPNKYCRKRIHENDIRAVMDLESDDLDLFVSREFRERFLHRHDTITIKYALGEQNTGNCPRCKNIYAKKVGCNHVRCPNLLCNTWFCWECGKEDVTWAHFIASNCHILFDDVLKGLYFLSFLLFAGGCTLAYITPSIVLGLFIFAPLAITFVTPYYILNWVGMQWRRHGAETFSKNQTIVFWSLFVPLYILLLPLGAIIGFLSLFPSSLIFVLFLLMLIVKLIPIVGQIMCIIEMLQCITGCFGYDDWLNWYRRSREEKDMDRVMDRNFRKEQNERLANPNVGR